MKTNALQDQALLSPDNYEINTNISDPEETNITVLEKKISQLETKYRQKWWHLEIHRSKSVTKDILTVCGVNSLNKTKLPCLLCQYCGSETQR